MSKPERDILAARGVCETRSTIRLALSQRVKVYVYGDAAVVNGRWKAKFVEKGKPVDTTERFTDTYVRQNGQWKCVASQGSTIK